ncbi:uncharacterized protein ACA1_063840, partial [Acanthamoeba castellanii str. Neff]
ADGLHNARTTHGRAGRWSERDADGPRAEGFLGRGHPDGRRGGRLDQQLPAGPGREGRPKAQGAQEEAEGAEGPQGQEAPPQAQPIAGRGLCQGRPRRSADQPRQTVTATPTATAAVTHHQHQHQHQHAHQNQQALHPMTINLVAPTMPTNLATRRDHQPQHPHGHHLVHSASYPNFPVGQAHHLHQPQRSHPMPAANSTSTTSPMMMAGAGEFFASHAVSMSMPTLPTLSSSSLLLNEPYATSTSTTSGGWHDAGSQWVDAGVPLQQPQPQHTMNAAFPPQPQHQMQMQGSGPAFDDSFLSSFLSSDILQAEEVALLTDLL